ncbi:MAG: sulfotransferase domain-containing protein [Flammeovirgaceae bacterium]
MSTSLPKIVWLISYPKSGTTWLRSIVTALCNEGKVHINQLLEETNYLENRYVFQQATDLPIELMNRREINQLRPFLVDYLRRKHPFQRPLYIKSHDRYGSPQKGYIIPETTQGIIYIIRNPLAIAPSLAHYLSVSNDQAIECLANEDMVFGSSHVFLSRTGSWSTHVRDWTSEKGIPLAVVRFEDLKHAPFDTLSSAFAKLHLHFPPHLLRKTIQATEFKKLKSQEQQTPYEGVPRNHVFFRRGEAESWKQELTTDQQKRIINRHGTIMEQFGYL